MLPHDSLSENNIGPEGAAALAGALPHCSTLEMLEYALSECKSHICPQEIDRCGGQS